MPARFETGAPFTYGNQPVKPQHYQNIFAAIGAAIGIVTMLALNHATGVVPGGAIGGALGGGLGAAAGAGLAVLIFGSGKTDDKDE